MKNIDTYDIVSSLIPGYVLLMIIDWSDFQPVFKSMPATASIAIAYVTGYFINAAGAWLEPIYMRLWRGKPSDKLLNGEGIKYPRLMKFKEYERIVKELSQEINPTSLEVSHNSKTIGIKDTDRLFRLAIKESRDDATVNKMNASYAFSRTMLTTVLVSCCILLIQYTQSELVSITHITISLVLLAISFWRSRERGYYYAIEVLWAYYRTKVSEAKK